MPSANATCTVLVVLLSGCAAASSQPGEDAGEARRVVARGLEAIGGAAAIEDAGGVVVTGEGTWDLGARLQGMHAFASEPVSLRERLAIDPAADRVVYETRSLVNPDAGEWLRYDMGADRSYVLELSGRRAFPGGPDPAPYMRQLPHVLLAEAQAAETLRVLPRTGGRDVVEYKPEDGAPLRLHFDARTGLLRAVEYTADVPVRGLVPVRWTFGEYGVVDGLGPFPSGYTLTLDGALLRNVRWSVRAGVAGSDLLEVPAYISLPEAPPSAPQQASGPPSSPPPPEVRDLAPGVFLLPNVRGGFHVLFVEFEDFVLAVDAPARWIEFQELPATDAPGDRAPTSVGARFIDGIRSRVPEKPIRWVALTHHHGDHAGGVRPFVRAGATVLAAPATRPVVEAALAAQHAGASAEVPLRFEMVEGSHTISDGAMEVQLIDVGPNPHADGMLAVWLPRQQILYVSDLFEPLGRGFPNPERVPVMRWFVDWLDGSGLAPEQIFAIHGSARVTEEQLAAIRSLPGRR